MAKDSLWIAKTIVITMAIMLLVGALTIIGILTDRAFSEEENACATETQLTLDPALGTPQSLSHDKTHYHLLTKTAENSHNIITIDRCTHATNSVLNLK